MTLLVVTLIAVIYFCCRRCKKEKVDTFQKKNSTSEIEANNQHYVEQVQLDSPEIFEKEELIASPPTEKKHSVSHSRADSIFNLVNGSMKEGPTEEKKRSNTMRIVSP